MLDQRMEVPGRERNGIRAWGVADVNRRAAAPGRHSGVRFIANAQCGGKLIRSRRRADQRWI
ncbi:MAG TPA: hypothetical protein VN689_13145, partial [Burkholderiales bacterium]|nr:hypothetical protein [Burkholderiales bacterium]